MASVIKCDLGDEIKKDEKLRKMARMGERRNVTERDHLQDLSVEGRIIITLKQ
jgi:hypothetical protein